MCNITNEYLEELICDAGSAATRVLEERLGDELQQAKVTIEIAAGGVCESGAIVTGNDRAAGDEFTDPKVLARSYINKLKNAAEYWGVKFDLKAELDGLGFLTESDRRELAEELQ